MLLSVSFYPLKRKKPFYQWSYWARMDIGGWHLARKHAKIIFSPSASNQSLKTQRVPGAWWCETKPYLEFWMPTVPWASATRCNTLCDAGGSRAAAPSQPRHHGREQRHTYNHSVPRPPLCFSLQCSAVYSTVSHMRDSTLYYKTGPGLDDFAPLYASVIVLSTFSGSQAVTFGRFSLLDALSTYDGLSTTWPHP